jgi:uncharacterized GH25 family protein
MRQYLLTLLASAVAVASGFAHFVYVVPAKDGKTVTVVFSESLDPDEDVLIEKIASLKLTGVANGKETTVACKTGKHELTATLPAAAKLAYGSVTYGLMTRGDKPALLVYHPKAVLGGAGEKEATVGAKAALEVVPVAADGKTKFRLLTAGKPVADAEGSVLLPDGKKEKLKTDKDGYTAAFAGSGRFAVWLRHTEAKAGEHAGQKYDEVKHYATLVVDVK